MRSRGAAYDTRASGAKNLALIPKFQRGRTVSGEIMSPRTAFLGKLVGLYCIAVSLSIFAHAHQTVEIMKAMIQEPPLLYLAGLMGVTAGLAIVLAHNIWSGGGLPIMVTLFGWAALIKGILLLVLSPELESRLFIASSRFEQYPTLYASILLLLGGYLAYAGFRSAARPTTFIE